MGSASTLIVAEKVEQDAIGDGTIEGVEAGDLRICLLDSSKAAKIARRYLRRLNAERRGDDVTRSSLPEGDANALCIVTFNPDMTEKLGGGVKISESD